MDLGSLSITRPSPSPPLPPTEDLTNEPYHDHDHNYPHQTQTQTNLTLSIISSRGIAISFLSGVTLLTLSLIPILLTRGSLKALRSVIGASGLVWLFITGIVWLLLRNGNSREGGEGGYSRVTATTVVDFPEMDGVKDDTWLVVKRKVWEGWARVGMLVNGEEIRRLRVTYWYLLASALLQDGKSYMLPSPIPHTVPHFLLVVTNSIQHHPRRVHPFCENNPLHVTSSSHSRRPPHAAHRRPLVLLHTVHTKT